MGYFDKFKLGTSLCYNGRLDEETLTKFKTAGVDTFELSFSFDYWRELDFLNNPEQYRKLAERLKVTLWSLHLPFTSTFDISNLNDEQRRDTIDTDKTYIKAGAAAGVAVMVLHPSSEPILDCFRPERFRRSREAIIELREYCDSLGVKLAVEDLPRTCLCNRSSEMLRLLEGTGACVVYDTNHNLLEFSEKYLENIMSSGLDVISLHISDYDYQNERHWLPGRGKINWTAMLSVLEKYNYTGHLMYEVPQDRATFEELTDNMKQLRAGKIR